MEVASSRPYYLPTLSAAKSSKLSLLVKHHILAIVGEVRADWMRCRKMSDAKEELNRKMRVGRIKSRHSLKRLEGIRSASDDYGA